MSIFKEAEEEQSRLDLPDLVVTLVMQNYQLRHAVEILQAQLINAHSELYMLRTENRYLYQELQEGIVVQNVATKKFKDIRSEEPKEEISDPKGYYRILGVNPSLLRVLSPDQSEILLRGLFRAYAMIYHPDRGGSNEAMIKLNEAYDFLQNPANRNSYSK